MILSSRPGTVFQRSHWLRACACLCGALAILALAPQLQALHAAEPVPFGDRPTATGLPVGPIPLPHIGDEIGVALRDFAQPASAASGQTLQRRSEVLVEPQAAAPQTPAAVAPKARGVDANEIREKRALARSVVNLKNEYERLARYHDQLQRKFDKLSLSNEQLLKKHDQLQKSVGELARYSKELQANIAELRKTREQLRGNYDRLNGVYSELRRRGSDSDSASVAPPSLRAFSEVVPAGPANGESLNNNEVMRTGPAKFPPDFTN